VQIPVGYAQVNHFLGGTALPRGAQNTYGVRLLAGKPLPYTPTSLASFLGGVFRDAFAASVPTNVTFVKTRVKFGPQETGPFGEAPQGQTGQNNVAPDSPQVAVLVKKNTQFGGRKNAGRWFLPFVSELGTNSGGILTANDLAGLQAAANSFLTTVNNGSGTFLEMVVLHTDAVTEPSGVVSLSVEQQVATQRRRLRKVGGRRRGIL